MPTLSVSPSFSESRASRPRRTSRILISAHAWYGDLIGGSFRLASEFAEHLAQSGHEVTYVCCAVTGQDSAPKPEFVNGVRLVRYSPPRSSFGGLRRLAAHLASSRRVVSRLNSQKPFDAVQGHSPLQYFGALKALSSAQVTRSYAVHSPFDDEIAANRSSSHFSLAGTVATTIASRIDRSNLRNSDHVLTMSRYTLDCLERKHGGIAAKGSVLPGWVDTESFYSADDRQSLRHSLGESWNTNVPVFFTLRRLEQRMGLETLIAAAAILRKHGFHFRVLIGGGGSLRNQLQQQIIDLQLQDVVLLIGRIPEARLQAHYAAADCFVLPTRALECFGLIVLEAFACETPVIASNVAAIPELATYQGNEWLFPPGDANALADRMRQFLQGELNPAVGLREFAKSFDRKAMFARWTDALLHNRYTHSPCFAL